MPAALGRILEIAQADWVNRSPDLKRRGLDESYVADRLSGLGVSREGEVAFYFTRDLQEELKTACPSVLVTAHGFIESLKKTSLWESAAILATRDPYLALARLSEEFSRGHPQGPRRPLTRLEVHPTAWVHASVKLPRTGWIGPHCAVEAGAEVGEQVRLGAGVVIGEGAHIDEGTEVFSGAIVYPRVKIGKFCRIHAGAVIGADGFGYAPVVENGKAAGHQKIYHTGSVVIGNRVEVGANSCIDRGTFEDTFIGDDVKIDNLVQVGHNCKIDRGAIICGGVGIAGSAEIGAFAVLGGMSGVINKIQVAPGTKAGAFTLITKDTRPGDILAGNPAREHRDHLKVHAWLNQKALGRRERRGSSDE